MCNRFIRSIVSILLILTLSACSHTQQHAGQHALAPITQPEIAVRQQWANGDGSRMGPQYLQLGVAVDGDKLVAVDHNGKVIASSVKNGNKLWQTKLKHRIISTAAIGADKVIVSLDDAEIVALDANTGHEVWHVTVPNQAWAAPVIAEGKVLVKTIDGKLLALNVDDGKQLWVYDHGSPTVRLRMDSPLAVLPGGALVGFADGKVVAVNTVNGQPQWEQTLALPHGDQPLDRIVNISGAPVVVGDVAYVASFRGNVAAISLRDAHVLWTRQLSSYNGLAADADHLYVSGSDGSLWALNRTDGGVAWKQTQLEGVQLTQPVIVGGNVVVADSAGRVHWLAADDGRFLARAEVGGRGVVAPPVAEANTVIVTTTDGRLAAYQQA